MATKPTPAAEPDVVGQIILLRPDQIEVVDRLRPLDPVWVEALAGVMKAESQRTPIEVCQLPGRSNYTLVTGGHRHAAAAMNGRWLRCEVVTNDRADRKLREISENLHRRDLAPMDRAAFLAELVAVHKMRAGIDPAQDGRVASINARWQKTLQNEADDTTAMIASVYGWTDDIAAKVGLAPRTVRDDLLLHRRLSPSIIDALRGADHPVLANAAQLRVLAKLDEPAQRYLLRLLLHANAKLAGAPFDKVTTALAAWQGKAKPLPDAKRLSAFIGSYARMGVAERKAALGELAGMLPKGWSLTGPAGDGA